MEKYISKRAQELAESNTQNNDVMSKISELKSKLSPIIGAGNSIEGAISPYLEEITSFIDSGLIEEIGGKIKSGEFDKFAEDSINKVKESAKLIEEEYKKTVRELKTVGQQIESASSAFKENMDNADTILGYMRLKGAQVDFVTAPLTYLGEAAISGVMPTELDDGTLSPARKRMSPAKVSFVIEGLENVSNLSFVGYDFEKDEAVFSKDVSIAELKNDLIMHGKPGNSSFDVLSGLMNTSILESSEHKIFYADEETSTDFPQIKEISNTYPENSSFSPQNSKVVLNFKIKSGVNIVAKVGNNTYTFKLLDNTFVMESYPEIEFREMFVLSDSGYFTRNGIFEEVLSNSSVPASEKINVINEISMSEFQRKSASSVVGIRKSASQNRSQDDYQKDSLFCILGMGIISSIAGEVKKLEDPSTGANSGELKTIEFETDSGLISPLTSQINELKKLFSTGDMVVPSDQIDNVRQILTLYKSFGPSAYDAGAETSRLKEALNTISEQIKEIKKVEISESDAAKLSVDNVDEAKSEGIGKWIGSFGIIIYALLIYDVAKRFEQILGYAESGFFTLDSALANILLETGLAIITLAFGPAMSSIYQNFKDSSAVQFISNLGLKWKFIIGTGIGILVGGHFGFSLAENYSMAGNISDAIDLTLDENVFKFLPVKYSSVYSLMKVGGMNLLEFLAAHKALKVIKEKVLPLVSSMAPQFFKDLQMYLAGKIVKDFGIKVLSKTPQGKAVLKIISRDLDTAGGADPSQGFDSAEFMGRFAKAMSMTLELLMRSYNSLQKDNSQLKGLDSIVQDSLDGITDTASKRKAKAELASRVKFKGYSGSQDVLSLRRSSLSISHNIKKLAILSRFLENYRKESNMLYRLLKEV